MKFKTICADPPWRYGKWNHFGKLAPMPYRTMTVAEIAALPISAVAATDCDCYLWTTQHYLPDAFGVLTAWGFAYCQTLTWCKAPRGLGQGGLYCPTTEFILLGRKGRMPQGKRREDSTWWQVTRGKRHSQKPEFFQDLIEGMGDGPRLELFARRPRLGWTTIGNGIDGKDIRESLALLAQGSGQ